jgi:LemA protein
MFEASLKPPLVAMILIIVAVVVLIIIAVLYNSLISRKNQVQNAFGALDAFLQKRYDLIPNLVAVVKQYMSYEQGTLTKITELRTQAISGNLSPDQKAQVDNELSKSLGAIKVAVENYPDLKANDSFMELERSWNEIEEQISAARRNYNAAVTDYNNAVEMFPTNIFAGMMNYQRKPVLEIPEEERKNISATELFNK